MKVAYLFESEHAREILENMIIPQLEEDRHGVEVAGMMFFFDIKREDRHAPYGMRQMLLSERYR